MEQSSTGETNRQLKVEEIPLLLWNLEGLLLCSQEPILGELAYTQQTCVKEGTCSCKWVHIVHFCNALFFH